MAFDLYLDDAGPRMRHAWIDTHEEAILSPDTSRYPQLSRLQQEFYGAPRVSPRSSRRRPISTWRCGVSRSVRWAPQDSAARRRGA